MFLTYLEFVVGRVLLDNKGSPPTQRQLLVPGSSGGLVNDFIEANRIPSSCVPKLTSNQRLTTAIKRLRCLDLVTESGAYAPTERLSELFAQLDDNVRKWPLVLPFNEQKEPIWEKVEYRRVVRGYRIRKKKRGDSPNDST